MATGALLAYFWVTWILIGVISAACFVAGFKASP